MTVYFSGDSTANALPRPTDQSVDLAIMIPAYREADFVRDLLPRIRAAAELTLAFEILIVDTRAAPRRHRGGLRR